MKTEKNGDGNDNQNLDQVKFCDLYALDLPDNGICLIDPRAIEELLEVPPQELAISL
jgi:hypothetical protein